MLRVDEDKLIVDTPYNADFVADLKSTVSGRKWDAANRVWICKVTDRDAIEKLLSLHFNYIADAVGTKTVEILALSDDYEYGKAIYFNGFPLCKAWGRDSGARVCENVTLLEGSINSGGSVKNWTTKVSKGTKFRLTVPAGVSLTNSDTFQIVTDENNKVALIAEKEALLRRLAEIEKELSE